MGWDAIIVGARCAGSPCAHFLARAGKRVLLVDAASFPSDQPMSTHFIQPYGMRVIDELGLGDRVRDIAPPITTLASSCDDIVIDFHIPGGCCPRRIELDHVLLEGARAAGAEVLLQHRVVDVLREQDRVVGVIAEDRDGNKRELRARVVVGADGRNSTIADLVGAEKYFNYIGPRAFYWAYWPRPASFEQRTLIAFRGQNVRLVFPVNRDQIIMGIGFPRDEVDRWKADPRAALTAALREDPAFAPLVDSGEPLTKILGMVKVEYFMRRAAGPGWALVGDAGLHKDPTAGFGITDALRDARNLAAAILEETDAALERYWRQRDVDSLELFNYAGDLGEPDYDNPLTHLIYRKMQHSAELQDRVRRMFERELSPYAIITPGKVIRWTLGAMLRGKLDVLGPFFRAGKRGTEIARELERRKQLVPREAAPTAPKNYLEPSRV